MAKKEFDYHFAELGDFFTTSWIGKELKFEKDHSKEIQEELRLENLTKAQLKINITNHSLIGHPKSVLLKPEEVKHIKLKIPCNKIKNKHESFLILSSQNQIEKIPIKIKHI